VRKKRTPLSQGEKTPTSRILVETYHPRRPALRRREATEFRKEAFDFRALLGAAARTPQGTHSCGSVGGGAASGSGGDRIEAAIIAATYSVATSRVVTWTRAPRPRNRGWPMCRGSEPRTPRRGTRSRATRAPSTPPSETHNQTTPGGMRAGRAGRRALCRHSRAAVEEGAPFALR
jgi:hypothetical protein